MVGYMILCAYPPVVGVGCVKYGREEPLNHREDRLREVRQHLGPGPVPVRASPGPVPTGLSWRWTRPSSIWTVGQSETVPGGLYPSAVPCSAPGHRVPPPPPLSGKRVATRSDLPLPLGKDLAHSHQNCIKSSLSR